MEIDASRLLEPQLEDRVRRLSFLDTAVRAVEFLAQVKPKLLVNWMLESAWKHLDLDHKVVELPFTVAEDFTSSATPGDVIAARLDGCSYTLLDMLAGKKLKDTERALALASVIGLIAGGATSPKTIANLTVGCLFDLDASSERWAKTLVGLQEYLELAEVNSADERCAVDGCYGWKTSPRYCRAHTDACSYDRFMRAKAGEPLMRLSVGDALAFERMSRLDESMARSLARDVATPIC
jgi:hypothetical protein